MLSSVINDDFVGKYKGKGLTMFLGIDEDGKPMVVDRRDYSCLVRWSGITNSGKGESGLLDIFWLHSTQTKQTCEIYIHDPKRVDFEPLAGLNLIQSVGTSSTDFVKLIVKTHKELRRRQNLFVTARAKKIEEYNQKVPANALPFILLKTDEVISTILDLQSNPEIIGEVRPDFVEMKIRGTGDSAVEEPSYTKCWRRFENLLFDIASQARFAGIHWDAIAQQQKADALDTRIRDQASIAISFQVATSSDSLLAIGQTTGWGGAHRLSGKGDALVRLEGRVTRVYMPRVDDHLKADLLEHSEIQMAPKPALAMPVALSTPTFATFGLSDPATTLLSRVVTTKNLSVEKLRETAKAQQAMSASHPMIALSMFATSSPDAVELVRWLLGEAA
jgi:DNA segregation ATPase FtsK/SpoIIIE-like protein